MPSYPAKGIESMTVGATCSGLTYWGVPLFETRKILPQIKEALRGEA